MTFSEIHEPPESPTKVGGISPPSGGTAGLRLAFLLNLAFSLFELVGGILTNSVAIMSGAVHDLGDSFSFGLAWFLERYAERGSDPRYSYGYRRFSLLGALANIIIITTGSLLVLAETVPRLVNPQQPNAEGMVLIAVVGMIVNGAAVLRVKGGKTVSAQVVAFHLLGDMLAWGAVLVVSLVLVFRELPILDPLLSLLITSYILFNMVANLRKTLQLFLQAVPGAVDIREIEKKLLTIEKVKSVHHTHVWSLDGEHNVLTTHLVVESEATKNDIMLIRSRISLLLDDLDFEHTTVEIGFENEECRMKL